MNNGCRTSDDCNRGHICDEICINGVNFLYKYKCNYLGKDGYYFLTIFSRLTNNLIVCINNIQIFIVNTEMTLKLQIYNNQF